jgi:hypothetical protein
MGNVNVTIRNCSSSEMPLLIQLAQNDGRNPGLSDSHLLYICNPNGFLVAVNENSLVGSISAVNYDSTFSFIGFHFILNDFQNTGIVEKLLELALNITGDRNTGLNCAEYQIEFYKRFGFKTSHKILTYEGIANGEPASLENLVSPYSHSYSLLQQIDNECFPYERKELLQHWLQQRQSLLFAKFINDKYLGYGLFHPTVNGNKIAPLLSSDPDSAKQLFYALVSSMNNGTHFFIDIPEPNESAVRIAEDYGMKKIREEFRMYSKEDPIKSLKNIYGFTNNELG